jgi:hypothetical protein
MMAGLLDFLNSDDARLGIGLLAAGGPTTDPNQTGFGQRLNLAMAQADERKKAELQRQVAASQMMENTSQAQYRSAQNDIMRRKLDMQNQFMGFAPAPGAQPAQPTVGVPTATPALPATPTASATPASTLQPAAAMGARLTPDQTAKADAMPTQTPSGAMTAPQIAAQTGLDINALRADMLFNDGKSIGGWLKDASGPLPGTTTQGAGGVTMMYVRGAGGQLMQVPVPGSMQTYAQQQRINAEEGARMNPRKVVDPLSGEESERSTFDVLTNNDGRGAAPPTAASPATSPAFGITAAKGVPQTFTNATVWTESNGNANAVSSAGAKGRMQVMDATAKNPGFGIRPADPNNPADVERVGTELQGALMQKYGGNRALAAAAYNMGSNGLDKWLANGKGDMSKLPLETRNYVSSVLMRDGLLEQSGSAPGATAQAPTPAAAAPGRQPLISKLGPVQQAQLDAQGDMIRQGVGGTATETIKQSVATANAAQATLERLTSLESRLDTGNLYLGTLANKRLDLATLGETIGVTGKDTNERAANTRSAMKDLAQLELTYAQQMMRGQGQITENERALLQRAISGDIDKFTPTQMRTFIETMKKSSTHRINQNNQMLERIGAGAKPLDILRVAPQQANPAVQPSATQATPAAPAAPAAPRRADPTGSNWLGNGSPEGAIAAAQAAIAANPKAAPIVIERLKGLGLQLPGSPR